MQRRSPLRLPLILFALFIVAFLLRLCYAHTYDYALDDSYYQEQVVKTIADQGTSPSFDMFSYGGRYHPGLFIFSYISVPFYLLFGDWAFDIIPSFFSALCILLVGVIAYSLTKKESYVLISSGCALLIPGWFLYAKEFTPLAFHLFLFLLSILLFLEKEIHPAVFAAVFFLFALSSPLVIIFLIAGGIYLLMTLDSPFSKKDRERFLFMVSVTLWLIFIIYKKAILFHGISLIWNNLPSTYISSYFSDLSLLSMLTAIGVVPLMFGVYALYSASKEHKRNELLLFSVVVSITALWLFRMVETTIILSLLGLLMSALFAKGLFTLDGYIHKLKMKKIKYVIFALIISLFLITTILPAAQQTDPLLSLEEKNALHSLQLVNATIMTSLQQARAVSMLTNSPVVATTDFLFIDAPQYVVQDMDSLFSTFFFSQAKDILFRYRATHLIIFDRDVHHYGPLKYTDSCLVPVLQEPFQLYEVNCHS